MILVLEPMMSVPYESPEFDFVLIDELVPELRKSVEPDHVVDAPPTLFVNVPSTSSVWPDESVKLEAFVIVVLAVDVALLVIVHPPVVLLNKRLLKVEVPGFMVFPVVVALNFTVPELFANEPPETVNDPPTASMPDGIVGVPACTVNELVVVAFVSDQFHVPPLPLKIML